MNAGAGRRANRRRGEIEAMIGGKRRILCLTLGALAELETAFASSDLSALAGRFSSGRLSAGDIIAILAAGLRGGGNAMTEEDVALAEIEGGLAGAIRLVAALLAATFTELDPPAERAAARPLTGAPADAPLRETERRRRGPSRHPCRPQP